MTLELAGIGVVPTFDDRSEREQMPHANRIFVDASGRRARWVGRVGYLLGVSSVLYVGMVTLGLSGTRVAPMTTIPLSESNRIIAGLSGLGGSIGLPLTSEPFAAAPPAVVRATPAPTVSTRAAAAKTTSRTTTKQKAPASTPAPSGATASGKTSSDPSRSDSSRSDSSKSDSTKSDSTKTDSSKSDSAKSGSAKSDATKSTPDSES